VHEIVSRVEEFCVIKILQQMKNVTKHTVFALCLLSGLGLIFIGLRFFASPVTATVDFGIAHPTSQDFSFQHIKGGRDAFFGIAIVILLLKKQWQALGWILLLGTIIPATDFCIVATSATYTLAHAIPHLIAVIICLGCGAYYLKNCENQTQLAL
jgi:hypothetical protein